MIEGKPGAQEDTPEVKRAKAGEKEARKVIERKKGALAYEARKARAEAATREAAKVRSIRRTIARVADHSGYADESTCNPTTPYDDGEREWRRSLPYELR